MPFRRWLLRSSERGGDILAAALRECNKRASARIDPWKRAGSADRQKIRRRAWCLLFWASLRFSNYEQPELLVRVALQSPDNWLRQRLAGLLSVTDQPGLLDALEYAFRWRQEYGGWGGDEPGALLKIVYANPHLPRPLADPGDVDLALLAIVKDRLDLLPAFEQGALAWRLLEQLYNWIPGEVHDRCRRALRDLSDQAGVAAVCHAAILGNVHAIAAARDAGYWSGYPAWTPLFLLLTGQFDAYRQSDPDGRFLALACSVEGPGAPEDAIVRRILSCLVLGAEMPQDVAAAVRRSLRDLAPLGGDPAEDLRRQRMRAEIMSWALRLNPEAVAAVVDAGYLPDDPEEVPPLLFLTKQLLRYDLEDPGGARLRAVLAKTGHRYEHEHFRTVAKWAGRPDPWPQSSPRRRSAFGHATTWPSSLGADGHFGGHF